MTSYKLVNEEAFSRPVRSVKNKTWVQMIHRYFEFRNLFPNVSKTCVSNEIHLILESV